MENFQDISPEEWQYIDQFLNGELSADEEQAFRQKMDADPAFLRKVQEVKWLHTGIAEQALEKKLESFHQLVPAQKAPPVRRIPFARKLLAAAAILLLAALPLWWFLLHKSPEEKLYSEYYLPDPGLMTAMGTNANYLFEKAMVYYKNKEYKKATDNWETLQAKKPDNDTLHYFLGVAYQADHQDAKALPLLEWVAGKPGSVFYKEACWYTGLIYLKKGNREKAKDYLQRADHPRTEELLNRLKP